MSKSFCLGNFHTIREKQHLHHQQRLNYRSNRLNLCERICASCSCFLISFSQGLNGSSCGNNTYRSHRNGLKRMPKFRFQSTKGMDPKYLRNMKFAKKYNGKKREKSDD